MQKIKKLKNNSHIFKANKYLSIIQLFFLVSFIVQIIAIFLFPNDKYGFTTQIMDWFSKNWLIGHTGSFQELLDYNGWIIIYQSLIAISLWSLILFFLIEFFFLKNYFYISHCIHQTSSNKNHSIRVFFSSDCSTCEQRKVIGEKRTKSLFIASVFGFAMPYFWIKSYKMLKTRKEAYNYFFEETQSNVIDNKYFFQSFFLRNKKNKNIVATGMLYLLVISSSIGTIMMWVSYGLSFPIFEHLLENFEPSIDPLIPPEFALYDKFVKLSPLLSTLTYFTQFTNLTCFAYALTAMIKPRSNLFRNNTITIHLATYIIIVAVVYWLFLFQAAETFSTDPVIQKLLHVNLATTIILHGTTPLFFSLHALIIVRNNGTKPIEYWKSWSNLVIYPTTYGFFMYSLSIFAKPSVYGPFTNLNPYNRNEWLQSTLLFNFPEFGEPIFIFFVLLFIFAFWIIFSIFWFYAMQMYKIKKIKDIIKNKNLGSSYGENNFNFTAKKSSEKLPFDFFKKSISTKNLGKHDEKK